MPGELPIVANYRGMMTRAQQFGFIDAARKRLLEWAQAQHIPMVHIEFVVPFVESDFSLAAWLFYDTDTSVAIHGADGVTAALQDRFRATLRELGYPEQWIAKVDFVVDSRENVVQNYEGSYFYRLR